MAKKLELQKNVAVKNKKAEFEYHILQRYTAGIMLSGTEVKSVRAGKLNMVDCYCYFNRGELFVKNIHIAEYINGSFYNHEAKRERKLLLNKKELKKLEAKLKEKGLTVIPLMVHITERGFIKLDIGLAKGKKTFDKRNSIKEKDLKRDFDRKNIKF